MDISTLATQIGAVFGLQPSTLLLFIMISAANVGARLIPNDATGALGVLRQICSIIGLYVSSRVSSGVSVNDVAAAALKTPPIPEKVEEVK
jgi:hypothetical protein